MSPFYAFLYTSLDSAHLLVGSTQRMLHPEACVITLVLDQDVANSWFCIDLGVWIIPSKYTLRHAKCYGKSALREWELQGSKDGVEWQTLACHTQVLADLTHRCTWQISAPRQFHTCLLPCAAASAF